MLNEILKEKRKELNLTQQQVADQLNVTRQTLSNWEVGKSFSDIPTLIKISNLYQLSLDYMLKGDVNLMNKIKKNTNELEKYQKTTAILKMIVYGLLIVAFVYCTGYAIGKGWAYYIK
ncbi:helix-turn-helix transcriptional regulator [Facklamia miroungae]|uniref:Transcriptional regulator, contains XRE-family HTH domain n=1 Tax=Facklamia miroungae TaxID=120956 RepID=A0A1G7NVX8_9LACT|nr:helix-turn-helix transcriptional regulator [Facklamia miroungae]NKZ28484.1 helix-turn-helix transcriptional regulator [Facklamia miroungae]SDF78121.1 Transcriptional regulator, contains XRE-family HTH domain [Facklamia miroungae]